MHSNAFPRPLKRTARTRSAFTLIEMLIVLAIIGAIMTITITQFGNVFGTSQEDTARIFVNNSVSTPLEQYRIHVGNYPGSDQGLAALQSAPADASSRWRGPYIKENTELTDPWGNPYHYRYPGQKNPASTYDVWSAGPDKQSGTADDIGNWKSES